MLVGTNSDFIRAYNRRVVMEIIRRKGIVSRSDVARRTGLTLQAVSTIFGHLVEEGWISELGRRSTARGQPPVEYSLDPNSGISLGVTIDLDAVSAASVDLSGRVLSRSTTNVQKPGPDEAAAVVQNLVSEVTKNPSVKKRKVIGVGIGIPGTPDADTTGITTLPHIPGWEGAPFRKMVSSLLPYPVHIANDAIVAGLGESWFGSSERSRNAFYVLFAHGLNGAMLSEQRPYGGIWGVTGKFGHIPVEPQGLTCSGCGGRGCVECYASLISLLTALGRDQLGAQELDSLLKDNDPRVLAWLDQAVEHLTTALLAVENLFDPEAVIFGGRLPKAMLERMIKGVETHIAPRRMKIKSSHPTYMLATFLEDATLIGAATLPMYLEITPDIKLVFDQTHRG